MRQAGRPRPFRRLSAQILLWAAATPTLAAPAGGSGELAAGYLAQLLGGLVLVICVIVLLAWMARRLPGGVAQGNALIQVLAVRSIGARERLLLIQVGDEQVLIGVTPAGMRALHRLEHPVAADPEEPWSGDFASLLARFKSGGARS